MKRWGVATAIATLAIQFPVCGAELVRVSPVSERGGMFAVQVENLHKTPLTALLVTVTIEVEGKPKTVVSRYLDVYVNLGYDTPIRPGESRIMSVAPWPEQSPPKVTSAAAVFEDGRAYGPEAGLQVLIGRRQLLQQVLAHWRDQLSRMKGADIEGIETRVKGLIQTMEQESAQAPPSDMPVRSVASLVPVWVKSVLEAVKPDCSRTCATERLDYLLNGLTLWEEKVRKGLEEVAGSRGWP